MISFSSFAKWILCGEYSVVRGGKAIAFPLRNFSNCISFERKGDFFITNSEKSSEDTIFALLRIGCELLGIPLEKISGHIEIKSDIPIQSGLGSSAAICANIAKIFQHNGYCDDVFTLARCMENYFHRKSSGLDIAVALENRPIIFKENSVIEFLEPSFWPNMLLTYSGKKSMTFDCIGIVKDLFLRNEKIAIELNCQMNLASDMCEDAFKKSNFRELRDGIMLANDTFYKWGLYNESMSNHVEQLLSVGAVAAKPIGSGLGGYIISLWEEFPDEKLEFPGILHINQP
ncbi:MAG: hypothetical protein LBB21_01660 [Holosporaceae bacterium]|jgi:mevalonate kinase|nr:hypothetical protein [Holosporaceae bacterium]